MRRRILIPTLVVAVVLITFLACFLVASAQEYFFSLDRELVDVWIQADGSVTLEYYFTFSCDSSADTIDVVDLGLPLNSSYRISNMRADVDGIPVDHIGSDYEGGGSDGVAVWLGAGSIHPGRTGTVHVVVEQVGGVLYEDSDDADYASFRFTPTWFDSSLVYGSTDLTVRFHMPPGVQTEEPRWHKSPSGWPQDQPDTSLDAEGRPTYSWHNASAKPDRSYEFGASFPAQYVPEGSIQTRPSFLASLLSGLAGFFCNPVVIMIGVIATIVFFSSRSQKRRRMAYLPPSMKVEGVGIKRGLTAIEAAIVLETPLNRVLTMVLFGLLKKGAVTVLKDDPLEIKTREPLPEKLRAYEQEFLEALGKDGRIREKKLRPMMVALVKTVNNKMKGFSRKETVAYYRDIVRRAWLQVEGADTPEVRGQLLGEGLEWTMLDDNFADRTQSVFAEGPVYLPRWWGHYRPWAHTLPAGRPTAAPAGPSLPSGSIQLPTLPGADFAASIVRGVQGTAGRIVGSITDFTGGVTKVTNPPPKPSYSSSSRSSSGGSSSSCACACACAGCACACAGGGR